MSDTGQLSGAASSTDKTAARNPPVAPFTTSQLPEQDCVRWVPEQTPAERYLALLIFLLSFLYLYLFRRYSWVDPDEGIILQGAQRILDGQALYRDFFSFFTPGSDYFFALIFRVLGGSYLVAAPALAFMGRVALSPHFFSVR